MWATLKLWFAGFSPQCLFLLRSTSFFLLRSTGFRHADLAQTVKCLSTMPRPGFDPWVRKIPWRRKWQPTPVLLPRKSHGWRSLVQATVRGVAKGRARLSDFTFFLSSVVAACGLSSCGTHLVAPRHVGSSQTKDQTCVPCIARRILNHWTVK